MLVFCAFFWEGVVVGKENDGILFFSSTMCIIKIFGSTTLGLASNALKHSISFFNSLIVPHLSNSSSQIWST